MSNTSLSTLTPVTPRGPARLGRIAATAGFVLHRAAIAAHGLEIHLLSRTPEFAQFRLIPLGWDRQPLASEDQGGWGSNAITLPWSLSPSLLASHERRRLTAALGPAPLYHARCQWPIPGELRKVGYAQLRLEKPDGAPGMPRALVVERPKRFVALGVRPEVHYGVFRTPAELEHCVQRALELALVEDIFTEPLDEVATDALTRVYYALLGGFDIPLGDLLLTREAVRQLQAFWIFAQAQLRRRRVTRFGLASAKRKVVATPQQLPGKEHLLNELMLQELLAEGADGARRRIASFTVDRGHRQLLERVLVDGESTRQVAESLELDLNFANLLIRRFLVFVLDAG